MPTGVYKRSEIEKERIKKQGIRAGKKTRFKKGSKGFWLGKKRGELSREWKDNIAKANKGRKSSEATKKKLSDSAIKRGIKPSFEGRKHTQETKDKISRAFKGRFVGSKSSSWKGGITPITSQIRACFKYRQWRSDIFTRDDFSCVLCGARSGKGERVFLEADHYPKMFSVIFQENNITSLEEALACEEFWNINNGRTLCKICHNKTKGWKKQKVISQRDFV